MRQVKQQREIDTAIWRAQKVIDQLLPADGPLRVLDAGCGIRGNINFDKRAHVVGIDVSQISLREARHVDEKILGDIQTYPLHSRSYNAIVCWDVLEHLPSPQQALERFADALLPGGVLVLALPNVLSLKGLVTKLTPQVFHVWIYRHLLGYRNAGVEGAPPFRVFMRLSITVHALLRFAAAHGLAVEHIELYETLMLRDLLKWRSARLAWALLGLVVQAISLGCVDPNRSDVVVVFRRVGEVVP